jgi:hypothetical protein
VVDVHRADALTLAVVSTWQLAFSNQLKPPI